MTDRDCAKVRILAAEDHFGLRMGLLDSIGCEPDLAVVGVAGNGFEAVERYRELRPDLVLLDLHLAGAGGVQAIRTIRREFPDARIVVWTASDDGRELAEAVRAGACARLLPDSGREALLETIRTVAGMPTGNQAA